MRIQDVMTSDIVTIAPQATIAEAREKLRANKIHHLIVLEDKKILGVLSDRDVANRRNEMIVADVMTRDVATISPRATLRQAAGRMAARTIHCLPVMDRGKLTGIVTSTDLLRVLRKRGPRKRPVP